MEKAQAFDLMDMFSSGQEDKPTGEIIVGEDNDSLQSIFLGEDEPLPTEDTPPISNILDEVGEPEKEKESEEEEKFLTPSINLTDVAKNLLGIESYTTEDEEGNEVEIKLDETTLTQELFEELIRSKIEEVRESEKEGKISLKGVSDITKKIIEADKAGANVSELLELRSAYIDPLDGLDINTPEGQRQAIFLRKKAEGLSDKEISILTKGFEADGSLEEEATKADAELRSAVDRKIEMQKQAAEQAKVQRTEQLKEYKKSVKENFGEFDLSDQVKNKLTDLTSKEDENGSFQLDKMYWEARRDPKMAAKIALFLYDEKEFVAQLARKEVANNQIKNKQILKLVPKRGAGETQTNKQEGAGFPI